MVNQHDRTLHEIGRYWTEESQFKAFYFSTFFYARFLYFFRMLQNQSVICFPLKKTVWSFCPRSRIVWSMQQWRKHVLGL